MGDETFKNVKENRKQYDTVRQTNYRDNRDNRENRDVRDNQGQKFQNRDNNNNNRCIKLSNIFPNSNQFIKFIISEVKNIYE